LNQVAGISIRLRILKEPGVWQLEHNELERCREIDPVEDTERFLI